MKKIIIIILVTVFFILGCATTGGGKNYTSLAKEHSFNDFFPMPSTTRTFATVDEAYDWVKTAEAKFQSSSGKNKAKGLAARLIGPEVTRDQPVTVWCILRAGNRNSAIDLSNIENPLEKEIYDAVSATVVFLVFYEGRGTSISNFHLKSGWKYTSNSQIQSFTLDGNLYETDYPVGWATDKAFSYIRKEID